MEVPRGTGRRQDEKTGLAGLSHVAKVIERMVNQNTYDDITQGKSGEERVPTFMPACSLKGEQS